MTKCFLSLLLLSLLTSTGAFCQNEIFGRWKTIDDETNEPKSIVEIYKKGDQLHGKIVELINPPADDPDPVCDECPKDDPRYNQKVIGMEIIRDMKRNGDEFEGGTVLKPDEGKIYKCKIWLEDGDLKVRGYWGIFYRTQTWIRAN
ncbi:DUF2147 domain-containing protein [Fulvivirga sedimenti]|uniref:DUF2147 domain-containing protein n=1 Tax=Fulvivirga sedimenti TaxID=2879465 RepID=A0A9X1HK72_9BACT|nr:DUF2147 domain-containing protein [Fulvivirga sedimenti]MCA6073311.1 DUF2147 domain-containing protein [Fulvivirga sedimenti]